MADSQTPANPIEAFGPNEWIVDELYESYLVDRNSVDRAWWDFFATYRPDARHGNGSATAPAALGNGSPPAATTPTAAAAPSAPAAPVAPAPPAAAPVAPAPPAAATPVAPAPPAAA
ncbi:2-oxoglutarate dehydrogenase E1 subunit family protein, partial [Nostocoides sp.]|uniref:2-oxoglutarate dehydrogenase E1 subunit family protein n=1 Tax=Nostocoides sp. TaxID=1917966 RepID=UPI003BAE29E2